jgi:hypothetical protein
VSLLGMEGFWGDDKNGVEGGNAVVEHRHEFSETVIGRYTVPFSGLFKGSRERVAKSGELYSRQLSEDRGVELAEPAQPGKPNPQPPVITYGAQRSLFHNR